MSAPELLLVTPDLFDRGGGIARIARATALACHEAARDRGWRLVALALNDKGRGRDLRYLPEGAGYRGFGGSRVKLAHAVAAHAATRAHVGTVFCHVNLATLGLLCRAVRRGESRYAVVAHGIEVWKTLPVHRRYALRSATEVWPVSAYTGRLVASEQGVSSDRIRTIHNCLDPFWSERGSAVDPGERERFVLCACRMDVGDREKGVDVLIEAFSKVAPRSPGLKLVLVGDGNDASRLRMIAQQSAASAAIEFRGAVSDVELAQAYRECELFCLPSRKEGFGLVFVEAMSYGKPVVACRSTAVPEVVLDGESGVLVPYGERTALADAIVEIANDPARRRSMGEAARRRVDELFTFDAYRAQVSASIEHVFAAARASRLAPASG